MLPLGRRLKELRKERKLKQKEMARFLECTDRNYQKMEYGEINVPGLTLIKLADFFQVSLDYLVGRSDDPGAVKKIPAPRRAGRAGKSRGADLGGRVPDPL